MAVGRIVSGARARRAALRGGAGRRAGGAAGRATRVRSTVSAPRALPAPPTRLALPAAGRPAPITQLALPPGNPNANAGNAGAGRGAIRIPAAPPKRAGSTAS